MATVSYRARAQARRLGVGVLIVAFCAPLPARAEPLSPDPVQELERVVASWQAYRDGFPRLPPEAVAAYKKRLEKLVEAVTGPGELRRALLVLDPGEEDQRGGAAFAVYRQLARDVAARLKKALAQALEKGDAVECLAAVTLLGEMGVIPESTDGQTRPWGFRRCQLLAAELAPTLLDRLKVEKEPSVRAAVARTLGKISTDPKRAAPVLRELLGAREAGERRAAAEALGELLRTALRPPHPGGELPAIPAAVSMISVAGGGAQSDDPVASRLCRAALLEAARGVVGFLPPLRPGGYIPLADEPLSAEDKQMYTGQRAEIEKLWQTVGPLTRALDEQAVALARSLEKDDPEGCLSACKVLEALGDLRQRLLALDAETRAVPIPGTSRSTSCCPSWSRVRR
jgi:hypothetical protein